MSSAKFVGLLLITYNDAKNLEKMLSSLEKSIDYPTVIHCVDMMSSDISTDLLLDWREKQQNPNIKTIVVEQWPTLESLAKIMNHGFRQLMSRQECEYIGWIHPDATYENAWLSQLVATLQTFPNIAKICSHNSRDGYSSLEEPYPGHEQIYLVRRGVFFSVGLFDEHFIGIGGGEDLDMNYRILKEGWKVAIDPKSNVNHFGMGTRSKRDTTREQIHNRQHFIEKWGSWFDGEMFV